MGDNAGQLFFGAKISRKDFNHLSKTIFIRNEDYSEANPNSLLTLDNPYETEDYYLVVRDSERSTYNGGKSLGLRIDADPRWETALNEFIGEHNLKVESIGWHLVGHYC